jgi:hypothetical protein
LGALEDGELVAQQEDLQLLGAVRPQAQGAEVDEPVEQRSEREEDHLPSVHYEARAQDSRLQGELPLTSQRRTTGLVS